VYHNDQNVQCNPENSNVTILYEIGASRLRTWPGNVSSNECDSIYSPFLFPTCKFHICLQMLPFFDSQTHNC
jgi:hypothetical protein